MCWSTAAGVPRGLGQTSTQVPQKSRGHNWRNIDKQMDFNSCGQTLMPLHWGWLCTVPAFPVSQRSFHWKGRVFSRVFCCFFFFLLLLLFFSLKHEFGVTFNLLSGWKCVGYPKGSSMGRESKGCCVALRGCVALAALSHVPRKLALCHLWHFLLLPGWRFVFKIINYFSDLIGLAGEGKIYWKLFPPPFLKQTKKSL